MWILHVACDTLITDRHKLLGLIHNMACDMMPMSNATCAVFVTDVTDAALC